MTRHALETGPSVGANSPDTAKLTCRKCLKKGAMDGSDRCYFDAYETPEAAARAGATVVVSRAEKMADRVRGGLTHRPDGPPSDAVLTIRLRTLDAGLARLERLLAKAEAKPWSSRNVVAQERILRTAGWFVVEKAKIRLQRRLLKLGPQARISTIHVTLDPLMRELSNLHRTGWNQPRVLELPERTPSEAEEILASRADATVAGQ